MTNIMNERIWIWRSKRNNLFLPESLQILLDWCSLSHLLERKCKSSNSTFCTFSGCFRKVLKLFYFTNDRAFWYFPQRLRRKRKEKVWKVSSFTFVRFSLSGQNQKDDFIERCTQKKTAFFWRKIKCCTLKVFAYFNDAKKGGA